MFTQESSTRVEISSPFNPVHLTHVGYNPDNGEFTVKITSLKCQKRFRLAGVIYLLSRCLKKGLPKEWQMLLQQAGITKQDQQANPQAVIDIIGFYSENAAGKGDQNAVWSKFNNMKTPSPRTSPPTSPKPGMATNAASAAKRPPVPQRPAHTLTIYSTDVRPPEKTVPPPKPTSNEYYIIVQLYIIF